jgi:hypothetical protein
MTLSRRVAAIETSLSPTQLVLRWLAEAHAYGDIETYVASLLAADPPVAPLDRLAREAAHGARAAMRGKRPDVAASAVRSALRETVFRFELVMRINVTTHELLEKEQLLDALFAAHLVLLANETDRGRADPTYRERFTTLRHLAAMRVSELAAAQNAREIVEERYLASHDARFPQLAKAWQSQCEGTEQITNLAVRLAESDGVPPAVPSDPEVISRRTMELVVDLVEPAKGTALEKLGEDERALGIATGWLRTKVAVGEPVAEKEL